MFNTGLQVGSLLGFGFAPLVSLFQKKSLSSSYSKFMTNGPILGIIASTLLLASKTYLTPTLTSDGIDDRFVSTEFPVFIRIYYAIFSYILEHFELKIT